MVHPVRSRVRALPALLAWTAALPACEVVATQDAQESTGSMAPYGKIGGAPATTTDFGDRLGPTLALWADTVSPLAAPLTALQPVGPLAGVPSIGPDVVIGGVAVYLSTTSGKLVAMDLATRTVKWSSDAAFVSGWIASDGKAVCGSEPKAGAVTCVELGDGKLRFRTQVPHPGAPYEFALLSGVALHVGTKGGEIALDAVDMATGQVLYQHGVMAYQPALFPLGTGLVLALTKDCPDAATDCLAAVDPHTGALLGAWPHGGTLLWRQAGKAYFASRDAQYKRTAVVLDETTHQFTDATGELATLLTDLLPMPNHIIRHVAGPLADGGVFLNVRVFSSPGGKLCRFDAATRKLTWCIDGQDPKIRVHPNALFVSWSPSAGKSAYQPGTGDGLVTQNAVGLFFGHWGFNDTQLFEVH